MLDEVLLADFMKSYSSGINSEGFTGITLGIVVDTDDPLQMGRLRIFCPSLNDDPKAAQYVPWAIYASPFSGSIDNSSYTRGVGGEQVAESKGAVHYGFWAIPDLGAHVLVGCVDGDYRRRFWMACVPQHQETGTLHNGRWKHNAGEIEGPLTSDDAPMQPLYNNLKEAFGDKKKSPEWKSRAADYQATAIRDDFNQVPNNKKEKYVDQTNKSMVDGESDEWIKDAIGSHGYDWTGFKNYGAFLASRTFGMSSPGMHAFVMDDRPFNSRMKFRTTTGHQILLDDTNERIYIATNQGKNWVEMDSNGNVDVYSENHVSINAAADINFTAGQTIRLFAEEGIHMFAGHGITEKRTPLDEAPFKGQIRIQSDNDLHVLAQNIRMKSMLSTFHETGMDLYRKVGQSSFMDVENDINIRTITGNHVMSTAGSILSTAETDVKIFSQGKSSYGSVGNTEMSSFSGSASMSASTDVQIKSMNSNIDMEAGSLSGSGNISQTTPNSQQTVGNDGISSLTSGKVSSESSLHETAVSASGHAPGDPPIDAASANKIVVSSSNINIDAALGTIVNKTILNSQTYDVLSDKVDEVVIAVDILTKQVFLISEAVDSAVGGFSPPVSFDIACLDGNMFGSLPSSVLDLFPTLGDLNAALVLLGFPPTTIEGMGDLLNGNAALLAALGLPSYLSIPSFDSSCVGIMDVFAGIISLDGAEEVAPIPLRQMLDGIFNNGADYGPPQPTPEVAPISPPPQPAPPIIIGPI